MALIAVRPVTALKCALALLPPFPSGLCDA